MNGKTALVFGATGLVGSELSNLLATDEKYAHIKLFVRNPVAFSSNKKIEIIPTDFENLEKVQSQLAGDDLFCCIGSTIKKAGSQTQFRKIDFELVLKIAQMAEKKQVNHFLVISSLGANAKSSNFYLRTKGEMEEALSSLGFGKLTIVRPSILLGNRKEFRFGETIGKIIMRIIGRGMKGKLKKYKGIVAQDVAKALIILGNRNLSLSIVESDQLLELAKEY
jgi:uncharacterized protein YbjT (DUF2867 family)